MSEHIRIGTKGARTRQRLVDAMLLLVSRGGMPGGATVRSIAHHAGVTEAVLYRYFPNKESMFQEVWQSIQCPMMEAKVALLADDSKSIHEVLHEWIRVTYEQFDTDPAAFHYAMLADGTAEWREDPQYNTQSRVFAEWLGQHFSQEEIGMTAGRACDYFVALLLSVPRDVRAGMLPHPAAQYVDQTYAAAERLLGL